MNPELKGKRAAEMLEDEVFKDAVLQARESIKGEWLLAQTTEAREALWHKARAIDAVAGQLRKFRDNGVLAQHQNSKQGRT